MPSSVRLHGKTFDTRSDVGAAALSDWHRENDGDEADAGAFTHAAGTTVDAVDPYRVHLTFRHAGGTTTSFHRTWPDLLRAADDPHPAAAVHRGILADALARMEAGKGLHGGPAGPFGAVYADRMAAARAVLTRHHGPERYAREYARAVRRFAADPGSASRGDHAKVMADITARWPQLAYWLRTGRRVPTGEEPAPTARPRRDDTPTAAAPRRRPPPPSPPRPVPPPPPPPRRDDPPTVARPDPPVRFGMQDRSRYQPLVDAAGEAAPGIRRGWNYSPDEFWTHAGVLADCLRDEDDPRADMVAHQIAAEQSHVAAGGLSPRLSAVRPGGRNVGHWVLRLPDGTGLTLRIQAAGARGRKPVRVHATWVAKTSDPVEWDRYQPYDATGYPVAFHQTFSPVEARGWADRFDAATAGRIHEILDHHFGSRS